MPQNRPRVRVYDLSQIAVVPPRPPHLAGVTSLLDLEASVAEPLYIYKRDAKCFFDQLRLPDHLVDYFGRPSLVAADVLRYTDMGLGELSKHCVGFERVDSSTVLTPCCLTWPMGFSWSSYLAQSTLLACLYAAGVKENSIVADDKAAPAQLGLNVALATDDVIVFARGQQIRARRAVQAIDNAISAAGIDAHRGKDVNEKSDATVIGIDVVDG